MEPVAPDSLKASRGTISQGLPYSSTYDRELYKKRNEVERLFRRLKAFEESFHALRNSMLCFSLFVYFAFIVEALR